MPQDPFLTPDVVEAAKKTFEIYSAYIAAGFSSDQALALTIAMTTAAMRNAGN
jgi:hypothetical protein